MKEYRITVEIDEEGRISADAGGFEGETCLTALEELLDELGGPTSEVKKKSEAFRTGVKTRGKGTVKLGRKP